MFRKVAREELKVPGRIEYLADLRDFVMRVGKKYGFSERVTNAFKLSIDEAATNIIKHAYRDWPGDITLRAIAKKNSLTMVLIDQGKFFDPRQVNDPDLQRYVEIGKKGGLGIFIMRRLLDNLDYRKTEEGNELWMVKKLDEARKRKIAFSAIPLTLKMRYWLYSLAVFSAVLLIVSAVNFFLGRNRILDDYIFRGRSACSFLGGQVSSNWTTVDAEVIDELKTQGSYDIEIRTGADESIKTLINSEHREDIKEVLLTDKRSVILASSDTNRTIWEEKFEIPEDAKVLRKFKDSVVYLIEEKNRAPVLNITWPIKSESGEHLADAQLQIDYDRIRDEMAQRNLSLLTGTLFFLLIVSGGLLLLIYVVMNPFKRLQEWVKNLNEPGFAEEMDIDTSSEIGAIAQAFSDMTVQLRKSQIDLVEQERLQQEMHIAKQIQQTLLPSEFPELEGYELASYYAAAKEVGGDFFDFVEVDKDTLGVAVADVSGKGVPGAFVMTMIRTALRSEARGVKDAAEVLAKVNDFVVDDMKKGMFVTLFYVIIDSKRRRINFASAGHNPLILHRPSKNKTYYLNPRGFPIGISLPDKELFRKSIESDTIALAEDDIILIYTDGVTEAMNPKRKMFGEERFLRLVRECGKKSANEFVGILQQEMNTFTEGNEQNDDITLVAIKEKLSVEQVEYKRAAKVYALVQKGLGIKEACKEAGISTYSYYQKYREKFESEGVDNFVVETVDDQVEAKHLSIEEKNKIYDIIRRFPDYGAKRICEELNTERYEFTQIPVSRVYEELVRMRLNTKQLREAFVQRGGKRKRIKPPGTPMLTVDGRVIMNRAQYEESEDEAVPPFKPETKEKPIVRPAPPADSASPLPKSDAPAAKSIYEIDRSLLLTSPLEELLDKRSPMSAEPVKADEDDLQRLADLGAQSSDSEELHDRPKDDEKGTPPQIKIVDPEKVEQTLAIDDDETAGVMKDEELIFSNGSDIELLSALGFAEEDQPFPFSAEFEQSPEDTIDLPADDQGSAADVDLQREDDVELDDWPQVEAETFRDDEMTLTLEDAVFEDDDLPIPQDQVAEHDDDVSADASEAGLLEVILPQNDDLFRLWADDADDQASNQSAATAELFNESAELTDPFEEFLEIQDEQGLITPEGELDLSVQEELFSGSPSFADLSSEEEWEDLEIKQSAPSSEQVSRREREDETISLDELVSLSADSEPIFTQADQEFDSLLIDAVSTDDKMRDLIKKPTEPESKPSTADQAVEQIDEALRLYQKGYYTEVIAKLQQLNRKLPQDHRFYLLLGNSLIRTGRYDEAVRAFERVLDLDPLNETARENLATAYANQGDLQRAIQQWERLLKLVPERHDLAVRIEKAKSFLERIQT